MTTLAVTYLLVWLAVVLYVARLRARQSRLRKQIEALKTQVSIDATGSQFSRAA